MTEKMRHSNPFPRAVLWGAGVLLALSMVAVAFGRYTGIGTVKNPQAVPQIVHSLHFDDRDDGAVVITDAASQEVVLELDPGTNGFARGVMRGMARGRKLEGLGNEVPFRLVSWTDGRLTLEDPATGHVVEMNAFGETQLESFATILHAASAKQGSVTQ